MGGELYPFSDASDAAVILVQDIRRAMNQNITIFMFADSKQVFDIMTRGKRPTENASSLMFLPPATDKDVLRLSALVSSVENTIRLMV